MAASTSDPLDLAQGSSPPGVRLVHPAYVTWSPVWRLLAEVHEGSGGFLTGTNLVAHPREWKDYTADIPVQPTKKLLARRKLARYENIAALILEQKRSALFREAIVRQVGPEDKQTPHPLETWWEDVDGCGTAMSDYMPEAWTLAALFGHTAHVMDSPQGAPSLTQADEPQPYLRLYSALDVTDWRTDDRGRLLAVRLAEAPLAIGIDQPLNTGAVTRERIVTETTWDVLSGGQRVDGGDHAFGTLPVVLHYAKRRALSSVLGSSILGDPKLYVDLYNLTSEIRELLRLQTFGLLNCPLGTGDQSVDVEKAKAMLGTETGAENVAFSPLPIQFIQPDTSNVTVYQAERDALIRTIYRQAAVSWEADSKDAEAEGSLQLKRDEGNQVIASYADECERTEYAIAKLWFRSQYGETWEKEWERAEVVIRYPDSFDITPFAEILEQAQAAISLEMPPKFMEELKCRLIEKFLPDASKETIEAIEKELADASKQAAKVGQTKHTALLQSMVSGAHPDAPLPQERAA